MWQDGENVYVEAELPGVTMDNLEVSFQDDELSIRGCRKAGLPQDAQALRLPLVAEGSDQQGLLADAQRLAETARFFGRRQIGRLEHLPEPVLEEMNRTLEETKENDGLTLVLALNYGSRTEITDAVREIARRARDNEIRPEEIDEQTISDHLYTAGMPDPDLLIRTAGEMRVSNYLLWQISYAELFVSDVLWPDFGVEDLHGAIRAFSQRNRRFGALDHTNTLR